MAAGTRSRKAGNPTAEGDAPLKMSITTADAEMICCLR